MQTEVNIKPLPLEGKEFQLIEYNDFVSLNTSKGSKIKSIGDKFAKLNAYFLEYLKGFSIPTSFIKLYNNNSIEYLKTEPFSFYIKILNVIDKRTAKLLDKKEGDDLPFPVFELHLGEGKDTLITESHLIAFDYCKPEDIKIIFRTCSKINAVLKAFFERRNIKFAESACFFGERNGKIYLTGEFTPAKLKLFNLESNGCSTNPYKISKPAELKNYTEFLINLTNA